MEWSLEPAVWLVNEHVGLRAPVLGDARDADAWYIGEGPVDADSVARKLMMRESIPWGRNPVITLVAVEPGSGRLVGGIMATRSSTGPCTLEVQVSGEDGPSSRVLLREMLGLVVPWLLDEVGVRTVVLETAADDEALIEAAEAAGMVVAVRRRAHVVRSGARVDLLQLERVNEEWGRYAG